MEPTCRFRITTYNPCSQAEAYTLANQEFRMSEAIAAGRGYTLPLARGFTCFGTRPKSQAETYTLANQEFRVNEAIAAGRGCTHSFPGGFTCFGTSRPYFTVTATLHSWHRPPETSRPRFASLRPHRIDLSLDRPDVHGLAPRSSLHLELLVDFVRLYRLASSGIPFFSFRSCRRSRSIQLCGSHPRIRKRSQRTSPIRLEDMFSPTFQHMLTHRIKEISSRVTSGLRSLRHRVFTTGIPANGSSRKILQQNPATRRMKTQVTQSPSLPISIST